jgi:hypothetical protein
MSYASMADTFTKQQVESLIAKVNQQLNVHVNPEDFKSASYSASSLKDLIVQKIVDELNGEWTADMAFHKAKNAIAKVKNISPSTLSDESSLEELFPKENRKELVSKVNAEMGIQMDILKPNGVLYGILLVIFFACIPFSFAFDWFIGSITMVVAAILIYILTKTGNSFRLKTLGHLADHLAWRNYLKQKKGFEPVSESDIRSKVEAIIQ